MRQPLSNADCGRCFPCMLLILSMWCRAVVPPAQARAGERARAGIGGPEAAPAACICHHYKASSGGPRQRCQAPSGESTARTRCESLTTACNSKSSQPCHDACPSLPRCWSCQTLISSSDVHNIIRDPAEAGVGAGAAQPLHEQCGFKPQITASVAMCRSRNLARRGAASP